MSIFFFLALGAVFFLFSSDILILLFSVAMVVGIVLTFRS